MKTWQLTKQAEHSLLDIASWTLKNFGEKQAVIYQNALIDCIDRLASNNPPHAKSCSQFVQNSATINKLFYCHQGKHFIVFRDNKKSIDILEFFHERVDLPYHLEKLK